LADKPRILITGSRGFIGNALFHALSGSGFDVVGICRCGPEDNRAIQADLLDPDQTRKAIDQVAPVSVLIHSAALAHAKSKESRSPAPSANLVMTRNLLQAFAERVPRIIFLSSVAVFGEAGRNAPVSVVDEPHPATEYGKSKLASEQLLISSRALNLEILRLAPVFDSDHMMDIRKRVFFPGSKNVKFEFRPAPRYSFCGLETVIQKVVSLLSENAPGRRLHMVADPDPYSQDQVAAWFEGRTVLVPTQLTRPIYWLLCLAPRAYRARCLYWKLIRSNIYTPGVREIESGGKAGLAQAQPVSESHSAASCGRP
jgi:nucleoside-diphosphate-sugar epimerase